MERLKSLESTVDALIEQCRRLDEDNQQLRMKEKSWSEERARLIKNNELARSRVESMITRLRDLSQEA
ncbi:TIGR02449 family protein [Biformimicrobium ophioploci]|uniref:TIGR02449 family protein n=1 Tax=Biformimicrobium ophioploci TaxID=3036711 RepID=A0ABQ6M0I7_9GAMM|nr:TIGR02449 family protein [Microbulbifer sp. NKW57]GMG87833.1 TIGR02449 family protein [Microbulbifer sp. NKW57]